METHAPAQALNTEWPCLDVVGQTAAGLVGITGDIYPVAIADIYPGTLMALGLLAAVHKARNTGQGEFFDVAMYDAMLTLMRSNLAAFGLTQKEPEKGKRALVPFGLFPAKNGQVAIAAPVESHWHHLCKSMQREDLIKDERTSSNAKRAANQTFTEDTVSIWTKAHSKEEIVNMLGGYVPVAPANSLAEVYDDPHVAARHMLETYQIPGTGNPKSALSASPIKFQNDPTSLYQSAADTWPTHR